MHVVCDRGFLIHLNHLAWLSENMNTELEVLFCPGWGICYRGWRSALTVQGFFCCTGYSGTISKLFLLLVVLFSSSLPFDPLFFKSLLAAIRVFVIIVRFCSCEFHSCLILYVFMFVCCYSCRSFFHHLLLRVIQFYFCLVLQLIIIFNRYLLGLTYWLFIF